MAEIGAGSGSGYPGALDTNSTLEVDGSTLARADVPNDIAAAVVAIETELGTDPAGTKTDVKTFLQVSHQTDGTHWRRSAKTDNYTVTTSDNMTLFEASTSGGNITFTLPSLSSATDNFILAFKKTHSSNSMIIDGNSSETIDGATTQTYTDDDDYVIIWSNGSDNWMIVSDPGGMANIVEDTTPQLGGDLDVNGNSVVTASNANLSITPNGSGDLILDGLKWPQADGTANYLLKTNGSAQLSWTQQTGKIVQVKKYTLGTAVSSSTVGSLPDNTIPQISEGYEVMTLAITPTSSTTRLFIFVNMAAGGGSTGYQSLALFQDSTANALASACNQNFGSGKSNTTCFFHDMVSGTTSETTFKVRFGTESGSGTSYFNGDPSVGSQVHGGVLGSGIFILEYSA